MREVMKRIFHQRSTSRRGFDSAVRTQALAIIMGSEPSEEEIRDIVEETTDPDHTDLDMYIQARLFLAAQQNPGIKQKLYNTLANVTFGNYHILAPKGKSLAFKENLAGNFIICTDIQIIKNLSCLMLINLDNLQLFKINVKP